MSTEINIDLNSEVNNTFNFDILHQIVQEYGTPTYVYSKSQIINNYNLYQSSFDNHNCENYLICYAVKANSNLNVLKQLAKLNSGFDIVSIGELKRVLKAGGQAGKTIFSGVGKQDFEIKEALEAGIHCFNVESEPELILINKIAKQINKKAPISIRVNPNINAESHPYISTGLKEHKFGIAIEQAENIYNLANELENINAQGIDCHIGSQLTDLRPIQETCLAINNLLKTLEQNNIIIPHINLGGGLGIDYHHNQSVIALPNANSWVKTILDNLEPKYIHNKKIIIEPGRSIVGNAGLLLTKVIYNKADPTHHHNFTIVDAAMNDLLRPALYHATHNIININNNPNSIEYNTINNKEYITSIVGPICESSDVFIRDYNLVSKPGDILAILDCGAYGAVMSSNYNSRLRAAEVMLDKDNYYLINPRQTYEDLYKNEIIF